MKFWVDNRLADEVELSVQEIASMYLGSGWVEEEALFQRKLHEFLTADLHLTWSIEDDPGFIDDLTDLIWARADVDDPWHIAPR